MAYRPVPRFQWIIIFRNLDGRVHNQWPPIELTLAQMKRKVNGKAGKVRGFLRVEAHGVDINLSFRPWWRESN